ncbi:epithelial chloride channel protein-like [Platysternon megacephalum]|uniref:Epithelial chloride channel protein-like n=1 Tax=Platysternon megacephalum TaxID=55544 RepID=A0A4D9EJA2_9SAUR|nr:epithelial chloride channel protein-like [Platysternon megacephalum]
MAVTRLQVAADVPSPTGSHLRPCLFGGLLPIRVLSPTSTSGVLSHPPSLSSSPVPSSVSLFLSLSHRLLLHPLFPSQLQAAATTHADFFTLPPILGWRRCPTGTLARLSPPSPPRSPEDTHGAQLFAAYVPPGAHVQQIQPTPDFLD